MIGTKKGIMQYSGFGPEAVWNLTYHTQKRSQKYDVWKIFAYILSHMHSWRDELRVRLYYGQGHILFRSRSNYGAEGVLIDRREIEKMLSGKKIADPYVQNIRLFFDTFASQVNGHHVRLYTDLTQFNLIRTDVYESWKKKKEGNIKGLYMNQSGFCRLDYVRQRRSCCVGKRDQCIYIYSQADHNHKGEHVVRYYCGKYVQNFSHNRDLLYEKGEIVGKKGVCDCLRGIEL